jgi:hypothetical protein
MGTGRRRCTSAACVTCSCSRLHCQPACTVVACDWWDAAGAWMLWNISNPGIRLQPSRWCCATAQCMRLLAASCWCSSTEVVVCTDDLVLFWPKAMRLAVGAMSWQPATSNKDAHVWYCLPLPTLDVSTGDICTTSNCPLAAGRAGPPAAGGGGQVPGSIPLRGLPLGPAGHHRQRGAQAARGAAAGAAGGGPPASLAASVTSSPARIPPGSVEGDKQIYAPSCMPVRFLDQHIVAGLLHGLCFLGLRPVVAASWTTA